MVNNSNKFGKKIIYFIFAPLIMSLFFIKQISFNVAYFIVALQFMVLITSIRDIKLSYNEKQIIIFFLLFLLFIIAMTSSLFSYMPLEVFRLSFIVFVPSLFIMLLTFSDDHPVSTFVGIFNFLMNLGFILALIAVVLFLFGDVTHISGKTVQAIKIGPLRIYQVIMGVYPFYRVASVTSNPNTLGMILMLGQIATLYLYKLKLITRKKFFVFYIIQIIGLLLTQSRSAVLTAFIMIILFSILTSKNKINKVKIFFISMIIVIYIYFLITKNSEYIGIFSRFKSGLSNRDLAWKILIDRIIDNPFIGIGFGASSEVSLYDLGIKAHNVFINCISEIGIIGFIIFICIWLLGIIYSFLEFNSYKINQKIKTTYALVFSILFSLIFHQMVENKLLVYDSFMFLWIYLISFSTIKLNIRDNKI